MNLISVSKLNKYFGERCLFENVSFSVESSDKIGLIGANGTGKTTLFKMLLDGDSKDGGDIFASKNLKFGYLEQHISSESDKNVYDELLTVFSHLKDIENEIMIVTGEIDAGIGDSKSNAERLNFLTEKFKDSNGYTYKSIAKSALLGMGFKENDLEKPFNSLSGGEKTRVCLCKLLLSDANLLLLDEPTNHLDIGAVEWLENFLQSYKGSFIVISHDRYFLDKVTNKTFELEHRELTCYNGNYSKYLKQKEENEKYLERKYENTMTEIKRIEGIISQQKQWNRERNIKTAESKQKSVDRLKATLVAPGSELENIKPKFIISKSGGNDVLEVKSLSKAFGENKLFTNVNFLIKRKERVFLLGANGCGKTTLFKILTGEYNSDFGNINIGANVEIGYYSQTQDTLSPEKTMFDEIRDEFTDLSNTEIRNALAGFLFKADDVFKEINTLSGGEKARLMLLKLMLKKANFLLLDEPTNHLDIKSREMLEDALKDFEGTIFAISHDRYFINKLANRIFKMDNGEVIIINGDYNYYLEKNSYKEEKDVPEKKVASAGKEDYLNKKKADAEIRKRKNRLATVEKLIEEKEANSDNLKASLELPENATDYVKCAEISKEIEKTEEELLTLYEEWESLQQDDR